MLSIATCSVNMAANYYEKDNYYAKESTQKDIWQGRGAEKMGLAGKPVNPQQFKELLEESGRGVAAYDLTFSAPKSVSIIAECAGDAERARIQAAHDASVKAVLREIEENEIFSRMTRDGVTAAEQTGEFAAAKFKHHVSREADPVLHTHAVILNKTGKDGRAIDGKRLFEVQKIYGAEYRARLAAELRRMGYALEITDAGKGFFEIAGFKEEVLEEFSKRRRQIEAEMEETGGSGGKAAARATLKTRKAKKSVNIEAARQNWRRALQEMGQRLPGRGVAMAVGAEEKIEAYREAVAALERGSIAWTEKEFEEKIIARGVLAGVTRREAVSMISYDTAILRGELRGERSKKFFSTKKILEQEKKIFEAVAAGRGTWRGIEAGRVAAGIRRMEAAHGWTLKEQQRRMVEHIATSEDKFIAVQGLAGTGKSFSLNVAREMMEAAGYEVRGVAPSGQAAKILGEDTGIKATTIHAALNAAEREAGNSIAGEDMEQKDKWRLDGLKTSRKKEIIFIDEAGMVDNAALAGLFDYAERRGAKVVLVGDDKQLPPVGRGNSFAELLRGEKISVATLDDIQRQKQNPELLKAVREIASGSTYEALARIEKNVHEVKGDAARLKAVAAEFLGLEASEREKTLVITAKNSERKQLNDLIRGGLVKRGELAEGVEFEAEDGGKPYKIRLSAGDKIIFLKNDKKLGVTNGLQGKILSINGKIFEVEAVGGARMQIDTGKYKHFDYAYCVTTHKSQGATVDRAIIHMSSKNKKLNNRNSFYVDISRAKHGVSIYTDSKEQLSGQVQEFAKKRTSKDFSFQKPLSPVPAALAPAPDRLGQGRGAEKRGGMEKFGLEEACDLTADAAGLAGDVLSLIPVVGKIAAAPLKTANKILKGAAKAAKISEKIGEFLDKNEKNEREQIMEKPGEISKAVMARGQVGQGLAESREKKKEIGLSL